MSDDELTDELTASEEPDPFAGTHGHEHVRARLSGAG